MRKLLAILAVVALFAVAAQADIVMDFYPTKDSGINRAGGEDYANMGAISQCRVAKFRQHYALMNFDWAAIEAFRAANMGPGITFKYEFSMVSAQDGLNNVNARIVIVCNSVDWAEGDGASQFTNFNWTDPKVNAAVTSHYAQTLAMDNPAPPPPYVVDATNSTGAWPWGDMDAGRGTQWFYNPANLVFGLANVRTFVELQPWFMDDMLVKGTVWDWANDVAAGGPNGTIRGIYTYDVNNAGSNSEAYLSNAGTDKSPLIRVTVIPEPASLALIGMGGLALLLRKRR